MPPQGGKLSEMASVGLGDSALLLQEAGVLLDTEAHASADQGLQHRSGQVRLSLIKLG